MKNVHSYEVEVKWAGTPGRGTESYTSYSRDHIISIAGKNSIEASSDPSFRGNASRYNPEELLVASLSSCHMLWFLHLCADEGIVVTKYTDNARGTMIQTAEGGGRFSEVMLNPLVLVTKEPQIDLRELHNKANQLCFIANSCNFPVLHHSSYSIIDRL